MKQNGSIPSTDLGKQQDQSDPLLTIALLINKNGLFKHCHRVCILKRTPPFKYKQVLLGFLQGKKTAHY